MVQEANVKRMHSEKLLEDANHQVLSFVLLSSVTDLGEKMCSPTRI